MAWHNDEFTHSSRSSAGYLYAHACQGDGEVCGVAVEYPTFTTSTVNVVENYDIEWPRLEADDFIDCNFPQLVPISSPCPVVGLSVPFFFKITLVRECFR